MAFSVVLGGFFRRGEQSGGTGEEAEGPAGAARGGVALEFGESGGGFRRVA